MKVQANKRREKSFDLEDLDLAKNEKVFFGKIKIIAVVLVVLLVLAIGAYTGVYLYATSPVNITANKEVTFVVNKGEGMNTVLERLEKEGLIRSAFLAKVFLKSSKIETFYAGEYTLSTSYDLQTIVYTLSGISNAKGETITVKFVEGKKLTYYAQVISDNFGYSYDDVIAQMNDKEYHQRLVNTYWWITDDILNDSLYYPLEGYLFPDTYEFNKNASIRDILNTMIKKMDSVLNEYKDEINSSSYGVHGLLTMASMVELEAVSAEDRALTAGVFYNRLAKGWSLGSDVTTYYDVKKDITESLTMSDLAACHGYNTRSGSCASSLPIGPIACVSLSSIKAAIEPTDTKNMYFVADVNNKLYFAETEAGHQANIRMLKSQGLWPE